MTESPPEPAIQRGALATALAAVQANLPKVIKAETGEVSGQNKEGKRYSYTYSYADLTAVTEAIMPLLAKHGLAFTAMPTLAGNVFVLRYQLMHSSGEQLVGEYPLGAPGNAQAVGSAITYARRYCLCAVTGVSPDDDDGAAATYSQQQRSVEPVDNDRAQAIGAVQGAWQFQYGPWDPEAAGASFDRWSGGEDVRTAPPGRLRQFAAYLSTLPKDDAGSDPADAPPAGKAEQTGSPKLMNDQQRGKAFALMNELGMTERQQQLDFFSRVAGRAMKSRSEVTFEEAKVIINKLQEGDVPVAEEDSPRMVARPQLRQIEALFKDLGIVDAQERLHVALSLVGRTPMHQGKPSSVGLSALEAQSLLDGLATCKTRDEVETLVQMAENERANTYEHRTGDDA